MFEIGQKRPGEWYLYKNGDPIKAIPWWIVDLMRKEDSLAMFESWLHGVYIKAHKEGHKEGVKQMQDNLKLIMGVDNA